MPILLVKNPVAVRSRTVPKKRTPCECSGFALAGYASASQTSVCWASVHLHERLRVALAALAIEPPETAAHHRLTIGLVDHHVVDELGHAGFAGIPGTFVLRDDQVGQRGDGRHLVRREVLRLVRRLGGGGRLLRLLRVLVRLLRLRLGPRDACHRGRGSEHLQHLASIHALHRFRSLTGPLGERPRSKSRGPCAVRRCNRTCARRGP